MPSINRTGTTGERQSILPGPGARETDSFAASRRVATRGIARRLILAMVLFSSLITLIVTAIQLYRDYQRDMLLIDSQLKQIQDVHLRSLAGSLWLLDESGMQVLVDGIMQLPDILYLEVNDGDRIWAQGGSNQQGNIILREFPLSYSHLGQQQEIGSLTVVATLDRVYQRLIDKTVDILISNAIKTFLVAGFMLMLFHYLVTRHLIDITESLRGQDMQKKTSPLQLDRKPARSGKTDELDLLVDELNQMRLSLGASFTTLRKSESRYRELYDTMAQGVIYRDDKGMITSANNAAEEILGLSIEQMLGRNDVNRVWKAIRENGEPIADAEFPTASALRTGKGVDNLVMGFYHPREQQYRWALVSSKTAQAADNDGKKLAFSTFTDITERRRAAIEREHLIRELENKNAELERFVYTISHELKTPLVTIAGYSGILMDEVDGGERLVLEDHVGQINAAIATMSTLLDELLELSRIGRVIYPQELFAFGDMVQEVALTVQSRAEKHQATIDVAADLPLVYGDRVRLREVMQNLVENAIKFSQKPVKPRIHVGWRQQAGEKVFFVEDNGIGVDPSYQLRIFGLFERLDPKTEGTGVGLALVQRIIQEHGGRVWVESEGIGQGSRFCFTIPSGKND